MSGRKRKITVMSDDDDDDGDYDYTSLPVGKSSRAKSVPKAKRARKSTAGSSAPEKRLARYRGHCPQNIMERVDRVMSQRFYMVARTRNGEELREEFKVLGSTGNVYTVVVDKLLACDCPDALKGNHCKHILFVMLKVLGVPQSSTLYYQKALLSSELATLFAQAPVATSSTIVSAQLREAYERATGVKSAGGSKTANDAQEKRIEEGDDCGVCFDGMDPRKLDSLTFCKTCCKPVHKVCFEQWARTARPLTCVYCRAPWPDTAATSSSNRAGGSSSRGAEGYMNLGSVAGLNPVRDTSSYYRGSRRGYRSYYSTYYSDDFY